MKAKYIQQLFKVKHTDEGFKKEHDPLFYFLAIFKQVYQFLTQYDKISQAPEAPYSVAPPLVASFSS